MYMKLRGSGLLRTRLQRAVGRGLSKFVGREREMEALKHAAELARQGHGQIVAAMAEPGVGKSRLYFEFKAVAQSDCMVLEAYSVSHGKASAYVPVVELLRKYFRIVSEDDPRQRRQKVIGKLLELDRSLEDAVPYVFGLLESMRVTIRSLKWMRRSGGAARRTRSSASCCARASTSR